MVAFLITIVVMALSLWIISKLPLGVEIDSPVHALLGGAIIGALSSMWNLFPSVVRGATWWLSLGIIPLIGSIIVFGLAAWLIDGFRLRWGIGSAFLGAITLGIVYSILTWLLSQVGIIVAG